jgi:E3 ubiquitin-protein ligase RNF14
MEELDTDDERATELSTLAAIFPELQIHPSDPYNASLELEVTPVKPVKIRFQEPLADPAPPHLPTPPSSDGVSLGHKPSVNVGVGNGNGAVAVGLGTHEVQHLPRLRINVQLPILYPAEQPPTVQLAVSPAWLTQAKLEELKADCARLWEEMGRDQVLYMFIDHLQSQTDDAFGLADGEALPMPADLRLELLDYDQKAKRAKFEQQTFECGICLEPKRGKECHPLIACGHVNCVPCLQDYYGNCIKEGDVDSVKCIDPSCGKEGAAGEPPLKKRRRDHTLNPSELLQIPLDPEQVKRYVQLIRKKKLESDKTTIYCPRKWCQGAARSKKRPKPTDLLEDFESDDEEDTAEDQDAKDAEPSSKLAVCEDCDFAFCCVCQKSWHGELGQCSPRKTKELEEEERKTAAYLKHFSTPCPTCAAPCQKSMGCNHMICFRCKTHFCYLCSAWLSADNPYSHFNTEGTPCHMRLWELEEGDGERPGRGFVLDWNNPLLNPEEAQLQQQREDHALRVADLARAVENVAADPRAPVLDDTDDEVAPDVHRHRRRERAIEFVNFAAPGGQQAQRVIIPDQVEEPPAPPQALGHAQQQRQGRNAARRRNDRQRRQQEQQGRMGGRNARAPYVR